MTRLLLALLSAGAGAALGGWAALWWRDRVPMGQRRLYRTVFPYLDDRLGATKKENQIRANRRFKVIHKRAWYWWLVPIAVRRAVADYFWAVPQIGGGGASALPSTKRMAQYLTLELGPPAQPKGLLEHVLAWFGVRPYRRWSITAIQVRPTSEVSALAGQYPGSLIPWVAWALGLASADQVAIDPPAAETLGDGYLRYARKGPAPDIPMGMPTGVNADA